MVSSFGITNYSYHGMLQKGKALRALALALVLHLGIPEVFEG
jgi:hypothetical protein